MSASELPIINAKILKFIDAVLEDRAFVSNLRAINPLDDGEQLSTKYDTISQAERIASTPLWVRLFSLSERNMSAVIVD